MKREQRRLAAIVSADVAGYSRLMGRDESGTVARLRRARAERLEPVLARRGGRVVKLTGDGALIEFGSAVEALSAAIEFQQAITESEADRPEAERLVFRVGVHLGDVIVDGDDLYGDGVNVAARLEAEAPAGGIIISGDMHNFAASRVAATFEDLGRLALKNIERPVQAYAVRWQSNDWPLASAIASPSATATPAPPDIPLPLPDKPSIAVLPFQNMSGDPEQEYFADGVVEDIITGLSRNRELFVIARNSSFTYRGKAVDVRQVGQDLGVRYVLEGSVRKAGGRVRITGQLIEAASGAHLWADRFDGALEDVFELQDQVTSSVVTTIGPAIQRAEIARSTTKPTEVLQAYDHYLRGLSSFYKYTDDGNNNALGEFQRSLTLDPGYARPLVMSAVCKTVRTAMGWPLDIDKERISAEEWVRCALRLDARDSFVLSRAGCVLSYFLRKVDESSTLIDRSLELDPNDAFAWTWSGWARLWLDNAEDAVKRFEHALRLNPLDPQIVHTQAGMAAAYSAMDRFVEAEIWAKKAFQEIPNYPPGLRILVGIQVRSGRIEEARKTLAVYLTVDPAARISSLQQRFFPGGGKATERMLNAFRVAGLPE